MKKYITLAVAAFILVVVPFTLMAMSHGSGEGKTEMVSEEYNAEEAKTTFEETCSKCHATSRALRAKKDIEGWKKTVSRMASYHKRQKGEPIPEEDQAAIVQYLLEVAGK